MGGAPTACLKEAVETEYPILDLIRRRWSPVVYCERPIEIEKLHTLFEAARWMPSSYNEQPWSFIIGIKGEGEAHERILQCLVAKNQAWAQSVPVLGLSVACLNFKKSGKPNRHAIHDVGLAMGGLILQAVALDLRVHQMAGFNVQQAREACHVPEGYEPVAAFGIGYIGDPQGADEEQRTRDESPRVRKPQNEFLFTGEWGASFGH